MCRKKSCFTVSECNYVTLYHLHLLYCLLNYLVVTWGYVVTGFCGTAAYILSMRESGLVAISNITREPTCSWCNRPLTFPHLLEYGTGQWGLNPTVYQHAQSDTHIIVDKLCIHTDIQYIWTHKLYKYPKRIHTRYWKFQFQDWRPMPSLIWECIIRLGCRNVACCFISVQALSLYFCLWMLRSCSSSPAPLPRLLQCL